MSKLICMGDCIIDFLPSAPKELTYTAKMGGAPANVCAAVAKLGAHACYFGKLANDNFGKFLLGELKKYGIDTSLTVIDETCKTGLVVVDLYEGGERDFFFYRDNPADANLHDYEVKKDIFEKGDVLHFCSISLMESPTKHAHERALQYARECGCLVSFDVNVRMHLWKDATKLRATVLDFLPYADFVKVTDEEMALLVGCECEVQGIQTLFEKAPNAKLIFLTKGEKGSAVYDRNLASRVYPAKSSEVVDTTGAGDCFIGSIIYKILQNECDLTVDGVDDAMKLAVNACSVVISRKGGAGAMPTLSEAEAVK